MPYGLGTCTSKPPPPPLLKPLLLPLLCPQILYIYSRIRPSLTELGCKSGRPGRGKNGIQKKTGLGKRDSEKRDSEKMGFGKRDSEKNGIRPSSRSGPARQKLDHLCLCSAVATPELQARVCMPRVAVPDLFLFVAKMAIICRKMWKKWAIL